MRKLSIIYIAFATALFVTSCSDDDSNAAEEMTITVEEEQFVFDAVGAIAEQTAEEAKKTINGKWNVGTPASSSKQNLSCDFLGVEFTDDRFALAFEITGVDPDTDENVDEVIYAYGPYTLVEGTDGTVTAVELFETIDGVDYKIATLTDIVVEETNNELNATFSVEFDLPEDIAEDFPCGNLSGNYSAEKDEPVVSSDQANDASNNFSKLVNAWRLDTIQIDGQNAPLGLFVAEEIFDAEEECAEIFDAAIESVGEGGSEQEFEIAFEQANEACENRLFELAADVDVEIEVTFSPYGSYILSASIDGITASVEVDDWEFSNTAQTELLVDGETQLVIDQITDTELRIIENIDEDDFQQQIIFSFSRNN